MSKNVGIVPYHFVQPLIDGLKELGFSDSFCYRRVEDTIVSLIQQLRKKKLLGSIVITELIFIK